MMAIIVLPVIYFIPGNVIVWLANLVSDCVQALMRVRTRTRSMHL